MFLTCCAVLWAYTVDPVQEERIVEGAEGNVGGDCPAQLLGVELAGDFLAELETKCYAVEVLNNTMSCSGRALPWHDVLAAQ